MRQRFKAPREIRKSRVYELEWSYLERQLKIRMQLIFLKFLVDLKISTQAPFFA